MDLNYQAPFDAAELHKDERIEEMKEKIIFDSVAGIRGEARNNTQRQPFSRDFYADATCRKHARLCVSRKKERKEERTDAKKEESVEEMETQTVSRNQTNQDVRWRGLKEIAGKDPGTGQANNI